MAAKIYNAEMQYLTIAYAKDVGLDNLNRVVWFDHRSLTHHDAGLAPLLVYSVVAPAFKVYIRKLVDTRKPISISEFLSYAWSDNLALGAPLSLEVKKDLLKADSGYCDWLNGVGVQVLATSSIKSIVAFERSSLDVWFGVHWAIEFDRDYDKSVELNVANDGLSSYDVFSANHASRFSMEQLHFDAWRKQEKRFIAKAAIADDWDTGVVVKKERAMPNPELALDVTELPLLHVEGLKELVAMWPGGRREFFRDLNAKAKDFDFWVAGRSDISEDDFEEIKRRAVINYSDRIDDWVLGGSYLLEARTRKQAIEIYELLSHGGEVHASYEIVGPDGELSSHRFLYLATNIDGLHIILFERGKPVENSLSEKHLFCFSGAVRAPMHVWESVKYIVDKRANFLNPAILGSVFYAEHREWLENMWGSDFP